MHCVFHLFKSTSIPVIYNCYQKNAFPVSPLLSVPPSDTLSLTLVVPFYLFLSLARSLNEIRVLAVRPHPPLPICQILPLHPCHFSLISQAPSLALPSYSFPLSRCRYLSLPHFASDSLSLPPSLHRSSSSSPISILQSK